MKYEVEGQLYNVQIIKKDNRNTYIRINSNMDIVVTTNYLATTSYVNNLLDTNYNFLCKAIKSKCKQKDKEDKFYLFGQSYDIIIDSTLDNIYIENNDIYVPSTKYMDKWLSKQMKTMYKEHLDKIYNMFTEDIPYPKLKIRTMKTRWGVCNKRDNSVTLNSKLVEYPLDKLDYVITHELSHFVHFDHSKAFWATVSEYCPNYKKLRNDLKE